MFILWDVSPLKNFSFTQRLLVLSNIYKRNLAKKQGSKCETGGNVFYYIHMCSWMKKHKYPLGNNTSGERQEKWKALTTPSTTCLFVLEKGTHLVCDCTK